MGEERDPLEGGGAVGVRAAEEFVPVAAPLAIIPTDDSGLAELADQCWPLEPSQSKMEDGGLKKVKK